jgi:hypothetical protein
MITIFKIFEKFNDKSKNYSYTITDKYKEYLIDKKTKKYNI